MKELVIPIQGMHCRACEITITDKLEELPDVKKADVSLKTKSATIYAHHLPPTSTIRKALQKAGYEIGYDTKPIFSRNIDDYTNLLYGIAVIMVFGIIFKYLNINDLAAFGTNGKTGGTMALIVGLTAGFSTCMALVGGLVLGLSARYAEKHPNATPMEKFKPHIFFNISRIVTFTVLGGVIGAIGSFLSLRGSALGLLTIFVGIVMFMIGLQLTEIFPRLSNGGLTLPTGLAKVLGLQHRRQKEYSHKNAMALGGLSFFLPCGFTQAMQLYAISTGHFTTGALIMGLFAIGTTPGLLAVGGLTSIVKGSFAKRFFKVVGVAVVAMALFNISNGYNLTGWPKPFEKPVTVSQNQPKATPLAVLYEKENEKPITTDNAASKEHTLRTVFYVKKDIFPSKFTVKVNEEYVLEVDAKEDGAGCMSTIMIPGLVDQPQYIKGGETNKLTFTAKRTGNFTITCAMGVPRGTITVI